MLGQSSDNISLNNHIGSFELAAWQEIDDSDLEAAVAVAGPNKTQKLNCLAPIKIDDRSLEQAGARASFAPTGSMVYCPRIDDGTLEMAGKLSAGPLFTKINCIGVNDGDLEMAGGISAGPRPGPVAPRNTIYPFCT